MNRTNRQKINKKIENLNLNNIAIGPNRALHLITTEYTFFSSALGTFSMTDHVSGHKTSLNKLKIEIIQSIFSDYKWNEIGNQKHMGNKNS